MKIKNTKTRALRVVLYVVLIALALVMLVPFAWMLSASFKLDKDVFISLLNGYPKTHGGRIMWISGVKSL